MITFFISINFEPKKLPLDQPFEEHEMSFIDHLEALRWHLVRSVIALLLFSIIAFIFIDSIFDNVFMAPANTNFWTYRMLCQLFPGSGCIEKIGFTIINTDLAGQFSKHISSSFITGFVFTFPYMLFEIWKFIKPALASKERKSASGIVAAGSLLFLIGLTFGYYFITPITVQFLGNYQLSSYINNYVDMDSYLDTVLMMSFSTGILFELPMVVFFLSSAGIVSAKLMRQYRKHAILVIIVLSAIITPGGDLTSLLLLAVPFYILYESSILVAVASYRKRIKKEELDVY